jgi:hypothetical protein
LIFVQYLEEGKNTIVAVPTVPCINHGFNWFLWYIFIFIFDWSHIQIWLIKKRSIDFVKLIDFHHGVDERLKLLLKTWLKPCKIVFENAVEIVFFKNFQIVLISKIIF